MPPNTSIGASLLASRFESFGDSSKTQTYLLLPWERPPNHEMLAATLPDVMSEEECTDIIEKCEERGFEPAKLAIGGYKQDLHQMYGSMKGASLMMYRQPKFCGKD